MSDTAPDSPQPSVPAPEQPNTPDVPQASTPYPSQPTQQAPPYPQSNQQALPYPTSDAPPNSTPALPYPTTNNQIGSAPPTLPYPTTNNQNGSAPPTLPYPASDTSGVSAPTALPNSTTSDPAYPPAAPPVVQSGPPLPGEATPMIPGTTTMSQGDAEKQPVLPPYSAPPPSYTDTFPEMQQQMQPPSQTTLYPPGGIPAQYHAPQPQEMVRINGAAPCQLECPKCHQQIVTSTRYESGILVYLVAFVCILFGGIFGCCLVPFCIAGLKDVHHSCPNCKHPIGRYDRLS